jgi:hypothetical protein
MYDVPFCLRVLACTCIMVCAFVCLHICVYAFVPTRVHLKDMWPYVTKTNASFFKYIHHTLAYFSYYNQLRGNEHSNDDSDHVVDIKWSRDRKIGKRGEREAEKGGYVDISTLLEVTLRETWRLSDFVWYNIFASYTRLREESAYAVTIANGHERDRTGPFAITP